jgi:rare lipoprotein A
MRRVAGVSPLNVSAVTWVAALAVVAVSVLASLYIADRIVSLPERAPRIAAVAPEPAQIPNRAKKAAREAVKQAARLEPEIATPEPEVVTPIPEEDGDEQDAQDAPAETGRASWYALPGPTASGERMDADALTAAHPSLPFGSQVRVANLDNGRVVVVRINDRGPFARNRIIDLSKGAAKELGMIEAGVARVSVSPAEYAVANNVAASGGALPQPR